MTTQCPPEQLEFQSFDRRNNMSGCIMLDFRRYDEADRLVKGDESVVFYNAWVDLPREHPSESSEFVNHFHILQRMILARPGRRQLKRMRPNPRPEPF